MARNPKTAASLARLRKRLEKVPVEVRAAAATEALLQAQRLARAQAYAAPKDEGDLAASLRVEGGKTGARWYVKAGGLKTTKPVRAAGKGNAPAYDYANALEFGTAKQPARPWFYPTYRARKTQIRGAISAIALKAARNFNGHGNE